MKSILNNGARRLAVSAACLLTACLGGVSAHAGTISFSYSLSGGPTGPPIVSGTSLILDGLFTGSILSGIPALNAAWNPVTYTDHSVADLTTVLLNGTFNIKFANGDMLFGNLFEDVSAVISTGGVGPFTQAFTFTGGTGAFVGATGTASGAGLGTSSVTTVSGSGTLTAAGVTTPEPASIALVLGGVVVFFTSRKLRLAAHGS
jgi:hypothetical protein